MSEDAPVSLTRDEVINCMTCVGRVTKWLKEDSNPDAEVIGRLTTLLEKLITMRDAE